MTAGNTSDLLRNHAEPQRATYVELFFDVILVFALTRLSHTLFTDLTWLGALHTVILLAAFWWVWVFTAWTTDRLNPAQPAIQVVIIPIMLGTLIMAGAAPTAFGEDGMIFAATYVIIQAAGPSSSRPRCAAGRRWRSARCSSSSGTASQECCGSRAH